MERKKFVPDSDFEAPKPLKWKKIGGGSMRLPGKIIKPGQVFEAFEDDIPVAFRKLVVCLSDDVRVKEAEKKLAEAKKPEELYELKERTKGWWDVISLETGKKLNERALREEEAKTLLATLKS